MSKPKQISLIIFGLLTLLIIVGLVSAYQFHISFKEKIKEKKFLTPTEYYAAPQSYRPMSQSNLTEIMQILKGRKYIEKTFPDKLRPGTWSWISTKEQCGELPLEPDLPDETKSCLLFIAQETMDPHFKKIFLQLGTFDSSGHLIATYQQNVLDQALQASETIELEPVLFAQYLRQQPISQIYTPLGEIPTACLNAVLSIEDVHFLEHSGISPSGMMRALIRNIGQGKWAQGGSTITQQMVKNYFLTSEKTLKRKFQEFLMAISLENYSSKDEILEIYLNILYMGQNGPFQVLGFPAAARFYFSKQIQDLNLAECSLLAALLNNPGLYNPFRKPDKALQRRNLVLEKMLEFNFISLKDKDQAQLAQAPVNQKEPFFETAPYYLLSVNKQLQNSGFSPDELIIFTGLDMKSQQAAQRAVQEQLAQLSKDDNLEAVLLSSEPITGLIQAVVGGRDFKKTQFNRALAHRQVGSLMKPLVFLNALLQPEKMGPLTTLNDQQFTYRFDRNRQSWTPDNYGKKYYGKVPMYFALKNSLNCATADLGIKTGLDSLVQLTQKLGVTSPLLPLPSLTLGAFELTPLEVLQIYSTLSQMGNARTLSFIRSAIDKQRNLLFENKAEPQQLIPKETVAVLVGMMKLVIDSGTAKSIRLNDYKHPAAGKTGTTSDSKDAWFAGFTPFQTTLSWVGYDNNVSSGFTGASGAVPIWTAYMKQTSSFYPSQDFVWPDGVHKINSVEHNNPTKEIELIDFIR